MEELEKAANEFSEKTFGNSVGALQNMCSEIWMNGAKSDAAKEYHTQGMYSEEEVLTLIKLHNSQMCELYWVESLDGEWFKDNKKKL